MSETIHNVDQPLTDEQRAILPKLQKMFRIAKGNASLEESATAMTMLQDLLLSHNLDASLLEQDIEGGQHAKDMLKGGAHEYQRTLWYWVAELNFCMHFVTQVWNEQAWTMRTERWSGDKIRQRGKHEYHHVLIGRKRNVAATVAMGTYLQQTIDRLAMEFVHNDPKLRYSRRANSFREGAAETVTDALYRRRQHLIDEERRKEREAMERASEAAGKGVSLETAITITSLAQTEKDLNYDFQMGKPPGTTAAERAARAAAKARADAEYTRWAAAHPEEAAKQEAERLVEAEKAAKRRSRSYTAPSKSYDSQAFYAGREKGKTIGIDPQATTNKPKGHLG